MASLPTSQTTIGRAAVALGVAAITGYIVNRMVSKRKIKKKATSSHSTATTHKPITVVGSVNADIYIECGMFAYLHL
jgi:hypothetical protein